jgi:hypothetical protein
MFFAKNSVVRAQVGQDLAHCRLGCAICYGDRIKSSRDLVIRCKTAGSEMRQNRHARSICRAFRH